MPDLYASLGKVSLTTQDTVVLLYDNTTGGQVIVKHIRCVNNSSTLSTAISMWMDTALPLDTNTTSLILPTADISNGGWAEFEGTIILDSGEKLYAAKRQSTLLTTANVTVTLFGLEMT